MSDQRMHAVSRSSALSRSALMDSLITGLLSQSPVPLSGKEIAQMRKSINIRKYKPVYAKSMLELTPDDIRNATSLYVVRTDIAPTAEYAGWTKHILPGTGEFAPLTMDIQEDYYFTRTRSRDIETIVGWVTRWEDHVSVYYVMNAKNEEEALRCIEQHANAVRENTPSRWIGDDPFKRQVEVSKIRERMNEYKLPSSRRRGGRHHKSRTKKSKRRSRQ